ncbi:MAG: ral secretory pathway protein, partial [Proteobacteria bacterium]|nr:ral secretory pathway protein [Pseudomonadota bacterium]
KLKIWPITPAEPGKEAETIDDVTILEDVEAFTLAYLKINDADGRTEWLKEWSEERMPALIRVDITVRGEPPWPSLLIAPVIEGRR